MSDKTYQLGPVTLRGERAPDSTADQRLLDNDGQADWLHTDPWRVLRIQSEFVEGFGALADLGPAVSVFGSARVQPDDPTYALAGEVAKHLVEAGYVRLTKSALDGRQRTWASFTRAGRQAFAAHMRALQALVASAEQAIAAE